MRFLVALFALVSVLAIGGCQCGTSCGVSCPVPNTSCKDCDCSAKKTSQKPTVMWDKKNRLVRAAVPSVCGCGAGCTSKHACPLPNRHR